MTATLARDYSQHGEQEVILAWADGLSGSFVDLGCFDGATYSNTAALADLGWPGICVDAAPDAVARCARRYADRPDVEVIFGALDPGSDDPARFWWTPNKQNTSTFLAPAADMAFVDVIVARVDLWWLAFRISSLPRPRFCSIDLEGANIQVLRWLVSHVDVDCVCVEANNPADRKAARELLAGWSECAEDNPWNLLFTRPVMA